MINQVKQLFGNKSTGITINAEEYNSLRKPVNQLKFCEAVNYSFDTPILLNAEKIGCPGARRSLGIEDGGNELIKTISKNTKIPVSYVRNGLDNIPVIQTPISNIVLGLSEEMENKIQPDIFIAYTSPEIIMNFMHQAARLKIKPYIAPYSLHSICGNVFARAYGKNVISISLGCPESRKFGGVNREEMIIGIPYGLLKQFLQNN